MLPPSSPRRRGQQGLPKSLHPTTILNGVKTQKTSTIFYVVASRPNLPMLFP
jgi:hypothetical protein